MCVCVCELFTVRAECIGESELNVCKKEREREYVRSVCVCVCVCVSREVEIEWMRTCMWYATTYGMCTLHCPRP